MNKTDEKIKRFKDINMMAKKNSAVCFGSTFFADTEFQELAYDCGMDTPVYNRSVEDLTICDAQKVLTEAVYPMKPAKIFVSLGESDIESASFNADDFINKYEWMLLDIHRNCPASRIYIVSTICNDLMTREVNVKLEKLATSTGCDYINLAKLEVGDDFSERKIFSTLKPYMRTKPISFADAMGM